MIPANLCGSLCNPPWAAGLKKYSFLLSQGWGFYRQISNFLVFFSDDFFGGSLNKNENFSRPAAQGGLHRDSQGSTLKDGFTGAFQFSNFLKIYFIKKSSNPKAFSAKKLSFGPKIIPWKFREDRSTFRGYFNLVCHKKNNNNNKKNNKKNNTYHSKTCRQSRR